MQGETRVLVERLYICDCFVYFRPMGSITSIQRK